MAVPDGADRVVDDARATYARAIAAETTAAVARASAGRALFVALRARQAARLARGDELPPAPCVDCLRDVAVMPGERGVEVRPHTFVFQPGDPAYATCKSRHRQS
jgi:hypothetical protein